MDKVVLYRRIVILFIIIETFTIIEGYLHLPDSLLMVGVIALSFIWFPEAFMNKQTIAMAVYFIIIVFNVLIYGDSSYIAWTANEFLIPMTYLCIINSLLYNKDIEGLRLLSRIAIVIIAILSMCTISLLYSNPNVLRDSVMIENDPLVKKGLVNYGLIHGLSILFPLVIYSFKKQKKIAKKLLLLLFIAIEYYLLTRAGYTTAFLLATFSIVSAFLVSENHKKNVALFSFIALFFIFFLNKDLILSGLTSVQYIFIDTDIFPRLNDIYNFIHYENITGQASLRLELYELSWNTFIENPLFGSFQSPDIGGHSFLLDRLAYFGIIGGLPFFLFFYYTLKDHYNSIPKASRLYYMISILVFIALSFTKNLGGIQIYSYLLVVLPGLAFCDFTKTQAQKSTIKDE